MGHDPCEVGQFPDQVTEVGRTVPGVSTTLENWSVATLEK
jgi:hypothetical protein